jgi:hypothetical protein
LRWPDFSQLGATLITAMIAQRFRVELDPDARVPSGTTITLRAHRTHQCTSITAYIPYTPGSTLSDKGRSRGPRQLNKQSSSRRTARRSRPVH